MFPPFDQAAVRHWRLQLWRLQGLRRLEQELVLDRILAAPRRAHLEALRQYIDDFDNGVVAGPRF